MPYYAYFCNHCGHNGIRYHNVRVCEKCGVVWSKAKTGLLLESYPNIMPDHMGKAVREALEEIKRLRKRLEEVSNGG